MLVQLERRNAAPAPAPAPAPYAGARVAMTVRPATIEDMALVEPLINGFAARGLMLPKTRDQLYRNFREFVVAVDESGRVHGCGALRVFDPTLAEVASLAVDAQSHGTGIGRRIVTALREQAELHGIATLFALTLEPFFFHRLGFSTVDKDRFPPKVMADCANCPKRFACPEIAVELALVPSTTDKDSSDA